MLSQKIQQDYVIALKAKEQARVDVLRFLSSAIKNKEIEKQQELTDNEIIDVIRKQIKQLTEAATMFQKGGRTDLADANQKQIEILSVYLPAEMTGDQLRLEVEKIIAENQSLYEQNPKAIIGVVMGKLKGQADTSRILAIVNSQIPL